MGAFFENVWQTLVTYGHRVLTYDLWVVAVELLLIALMVWQVLRFLRGTRGMRLVRGFALLLGMVYIVIRLLPRSFGWERIEFLYGKFLLFAFVAVVVAFQPELRRALIQLGQARFMHPPHRAVEAMVAALVESVSYLARQKTGAIVAIQRTVGLGGLAETGTPIDARLTPSLLNTIFYPATPLHDMGVIVQEGRIVAAGCQFPLVESSEVDPSLGSRHRAALGLARESDAVVLVVSEETGRVALAVDGQLSIGLEVKDLRELLLSMLLSPAQQQRRKREARKERGPAS
jgi:diadenylate cyclase